LPQQTTQDRIVVCDCFTLFRGIVGPPEGSDALLLSLFGPYAAGSYVGLTTNEEFDRAMTIVAEHADRRPDKFNAAAASWAKSQLEAIEAGSWARFAVREHPTVEVLRQHDHLVLLSAAERWGAGFLTTRNPDLLSIGEYRSVKLRPAPRSAGGTPRRLGRFGTKSTLCNAKPASGHSP
jgi:hypothetical protein